MVKKIFIQLFLFLIVIFVSYWTYIKYLKTDEIVLNENVFDETLLKKKNNLIRNINYESKDLKGQKYIIKSAYGEISNENFEIILMSDVQAYVILDNSKRIKIKSDKAEYNNVNYNTKFKDNVILNYDDHKLNSENIDIYFDKNLLEAYKNLVYENSDLIFFADKLEIDLITKNSKIYNFDETKIQIQSLNKNGNN